MVELLGQKNLYAKLKRNLDESKNKALPEKADLGRM